MRNLSSWLLVMFMAMFWLFRVIVALSVQFGGNDFAGFIVFDFNTEIVLLFTTIVCLVLVVKRFFIGAIAYLITYGYYFGTYLLNNLLLNKPEAGLSTDIIQNGLVSAIAIILSALVLIDLLIDKATRKSFSDRKTDWYFKTDKYDRKYDERADKNQYRNY